MSGGYSQEEIEELVLGGILIEEDGDRQGNIISMLSPECFTSSNFSRIFRHMEELAASGELSDALSVGIAEPGNNSYRAAVVRASIAGMGVVNVERIASVLAADRVKRDTAGLCEDSAREIREGKEPGAIAATLPDEFDAMLRDGNGRIEPIRTAVKGVVDSLQEMAKNGGKMLGIETGIDDLDAQTSGMCSPDLVIVAARPSMGKTALATHFAQSAAFAGKKPLFISLEMSTEQMVQRLASAKAGVNIQRMRCGNIREHEWPKIIDALGKVEAYDIRVTDKIGYTVAEVAQVLATNRDIDILFIDYLQLMRGDGETREREIAQITRDLKALAKRYDMPIVVLAQLNRQLEARGDKRPMLSDLRESGAIEQDADVVLFVYRDEYYNPGTQDKGIAELIIGKQRNGPTGTVKCRWIADTASFRNIVR